MAKQSHWGEGHRKDPLGQQSEEMRFVVRVGGSAGAKEEDDREVDLLGRLTKTKHGEVDAD